MSHSAKPGPGVFPTTAWHTLRAAVEDPDALGQLLAVYRGPLIEHLRRVKKVPDADAEDLVHRFLVERILARPEAGGSQFLGRADETRGRFRTYLLTALDRFCIDCHRAVAARKEAPNRAAHLSGDVANAGDDPGDVLDVALGLKLLGLAVRRLEAACRVAGRPDHWGLFEGRVLSLVTGGQSVPYAVLARRWGFAGEKPTANAFQAVQNRFRRCWAEVVAENCGADPGAEMEALVGALSRAGPDLLDGLREQLWGELPAMTQATAAPCVPPELENLLRPVVVEPRDPATLLQHLLDAPAWAGALDLAPPLVARLQAAGGAHRACLADVFRHPAPGLELLMIVKEAAKSSRVDPAGPFPPEVATVLYYSAIAAALVRYGVKITGHELVVVQSGLSWLTAQPWVNASLRDLAAEAIAHVD